VRLHHAPGRTRQVGRFWALAGILALGCAPLSSFSTVQQSWMVVGFELAIPVSYRGRRSIKVDAHFPAVAGSWLGRGGRAAPHRPR